MKRGRSALLASKSSSPQDSAVWSRRGTRFPPTPSRSPGRRPRSGEERSEVALINRAVCVVEEREGRPGVVQAERSNRQARKIVGLLLREVAALRGHTQQLA